MTKLISVHTIQDTKGHRLSGEFIDIDFSDPVYAVARMANGKNHAIPHRIITRVTTWTEEDK